jgi:hypothetical protein
MENLMMGKPNKTSCSPKQLKINMESLEKPKTYNLQVTTAEAALPFVVGMQLNTLH